MEGKRLGASGMVDSGTPDCNDRAAVCGVIRDDAALTGLDRAERQQIAIPVIRPL